MGEAAGGGVGAVVVVGGGRMGAAMALGLLDAAAPGSAEITVVEPAADRRHQLERDHPGLRTAEAASADVVGGSAGVVLAVKPEIAEGVCRVLGALGVPRLLSVVAGISTARLEDRLPGPVPVVRAMPNTPALVGRAVSAMSGGSHVGAGDLDWAESVLGAVGTVVRVPERQLDAVTGLSGSGPAYVFLVAEALIEAGVLAGLDREHARTLAIGTLSGAVRLLEETGSSPEVLRAQVTSPGGTTAAGLRALEARAVRSAFMEAVASAAERSRQLGR